MSSPIVSRYGEDASQFGELYRPAIAARPGTIVIIHGGFWRSRYDLALGRPLAADLAGRGYSVWNLEYRRVGNGGGWPATLQDVADGIDHLASLDVDLGEVIAIGHSAGGHLAVWAAGRGRLPDGAPGAAPTVPLTRVISQAGVLDLTGGAAERVGAGAITDLLGGTPVKLRQRYELADPLLAVPLDVRVVCLHSRRDDNVPYRQSTRYVDAARAAGADAQLVETTGDHFTMIDPRHRDWETAVQHISLD